MTESKLRTNSDEYNHATRMKQLIHEEHNSAHNHHAIFEALDTGRAKDINSEPKVRRDPCIIVGSGPSLDEALPLLKDWEGGIICTTSHALTLMHWGVEPTHIMALDPFCTWDEIDGVDWSKTNTKLITHPGVWPTLVQTWPNDMLLYRQNLGKSGHFYQNEQKRAYTNREILDNDLRKAIFHPVIPSEITLFACSPPAQAFAANVLGYGTIFMVGVDFAYHSGLERFTGWSVKDGEWVESKSPFRGENVEERPNDMTMGNAPDNSMIQTDNGLWTHQVHLYYKKNTISALRLSGQNAVWVGEGAVTEYPTTTPKKMVETQGKGFKRLTRKQIRDITDAYLAKVGAFVIEAGPERMAFVESNDPEKDLYNAMLGMDRKYVCDNCGAVGDAPDDRDYTGAACKVCQKPDGMHRLNEGLDIEANMKRFRKLIKGTAMQRPEHPAMLESATDGIALVSNQNP